MVGKSVILLKSETCCDYLQKHESLRNWANWEINVSTPRYAKFIIVQVVEFVFKIAEVSCQRFDYLDIIMSSQMETKHFLVSKSLSNFSRGPFTNS